MWGWDQHMGGYGGWMGGIGILLMVVFWVLVILAIVALIRWLNAERGRGEASAPERKTALTILEERYAKGEIEREEFERKRQDLTQ